MTHGAVAVPGRPTLEEVARLAGVSRATVSRVINASPKVSPEVQTAVEAAIAELNYVPNRAARSLVARATMSIALVVPEDAHRFFGDPYFADIVQGISDRLDASDYVLNLQLAHPSSPTEKTRRYLLGGNVDGALVVSHHSGDHFLASIGEALPVVFGGRPMHARGASGRPTDYYVDVDNRLGAVQGTRYLIDSGRRAIGTITGPQDMPAALDRAAGWRDALHEAGLSDERVAHGDFTEESGARAATELLDRHPDLDAIFVASDAMASGALSTLADRGHNVPRDVAVVGYDNSRYATRGPIPLTTVAQPTKEMGIVMADTLLRLLAGEKPKRVSLLPTELIRRASA
ncbi:LacI family DNA-binding transcriptional regulator [Intrasporangium calvum]|uniref:Transcriptional regulator, LacI family n=1 Tax=Intrasporangium calvum (strain ATCC 23552 / DSM 43043 / JCM 3097 / NBRC 12989 / NCIMB 10167 / NRRL B-3866 / 7 KIP) TaxID=710696 RepID=E6S7C3_INTC7|nr:LacI family DNA-binding transcriptional regulator [Intrasporangium calvum]ADU50086.1 transcriptional regulator, LacI family [Intrasporangium calvum DSM 43043]